MAYYKKYFDYFINKTFTNIKWGYMIFFVTNKCNAKCMHCFYWQKLNSTKNELSLSEIEKISKKTGYIQVLLLSGGEPFLRKDLFEIISLFIKNNNTQVVSIPTNALLTNRIIEIVKKLSENFPNVLFSINPSIDDLYERNDKLRGKKGSFDTSIKTLRELEKLKRSCSNLEIVINTTISNQNYTRIDEIIDYFKGFNITYHNFELLRGNPKEKNLNLPTIDEIKQLHKKIIKLREYYINKNSKNISFIEKFFERVSVLGIMKYIHSIKEKVLESKNLPFICSAGKNIFVLEPEGVVRLCELTPSIGNIRDYEYSIEKILRSKKAKMQFDKIKKCKCTHICFLNMSIAKDKKSPIKILVNFLKWKN